MCSSCSGDYENPDATAYELDEAEDVAPTVGYPELERESDSRLQQAIASAYAAYIERTEATSLRHS